MKQLQQNAQGFLSHLEYLLGLSPFTRKKKPEWKKLVSLLNNEGYNCRKSRKVSRDLVIQKPYKGPRKLPPVESRFEKSQGC